MDVNVKNFSSVPVDNYAVEVKLYDAEQQLVPEEQFETQSFDVGKIASGEQSSNKQAWAVKIHICGPQKTPISIRWF